MRGSISPCNVLQACTTWSAEMDGAAKRRQRLFSSVGRLLAAPSRMTTDGNARDAREERGVRRYCDALPSLHALTGSSLDGTSCGSACPSPLHSLPAVRPARDHSYGQVWKGQLQRRSAVTRRRLQPSRSGQLRSTRKHGSAVELAAGGCNSMAGPWPSSIDDAERGSSSKLACTLADVF